MIRYFSPYLFYYSFRIISIKYDDYRRRPADITPPYPPPSSSPTSSSPLRGHGMEVLCRLTWRQWECVGPYWVGVRASETPGSGTGVQWRERTVTTSLPLPSSVTNPGAKPPSLSPRVKPLVGLHASGTGGVSVVTQGPGDVLRQTCSGGSQRRGPRRGIPRRVIVRVNGRAPDTRWGSPRVGPVPGFGPLPLETRRGLVTSVVPSDPSATETGPVTGPGSFLDPTPGPTLPHVAPTYEVPRSSSIVGVAKPVSTSTGSVPTPGPRGTREHPSLVRLLNVVTPTSAGSAPDT